ncbi:MAG: cupin domain-containing protein [Xanthomonadales bacterium]|nr:cupin domain-containing protein [Xanthomonadales bacterium]
MKKSYQLQRLSASLIALLLLAAGVVSTAMAARLPDLPQAFDAGWKGEKTCEVLYETETVRVGRCSFAPGVGHEKHYHYPHFGYVLAGSTMQITDDEGVVEVRKVITGSTWSTSEITIHEALNIGDTTTSYLIVEPKYTLTE